MKRDEILFLNQLTKSLGESEVKLEEAYRKREFENFNNIKKIMIKIQNEIAKIIK
jgi:hypothetical protein